MTKKEAYKILGIHPEADEIEIKNRYRQLVRQIHPDAQTVPVKGSPAIQEIILAYKFLKKENFSSYETASSPASPEKSSAVWDAPLNVHAYREREVLHYAEDSFGRPAGHFCIARGKYLWKTEEDFPLFLLSLYQCSKNLLDEVDASLRRNAPSLLRQKVHPELCYLLAQQFIDGFSLLKELTKEEPADSADLYTFYMPAMLETPDGKYSPSPGDLLFPSRLCQHRLYVKDGFGRELGYLSFLDDRLYYVVIPLFEQRRALVKIQMSSEQKKNGRTACCRLQLWIRTPKEAPCSMPENLNLQIESLLQRYREG